MNRMGFKVQQGFIYLHRFKPIWQATDVIEWLRSNEEEVRKKACDAVGCGKVEAAIGDWKICKGCLEWCYCGVECQTKDWKTGGHKKACRASVSTLNRWLGLEVQRNHFT